MIAEKKTAIKKIAKKAAPKPKAEKAVKKPVSKYIFAIGRRKTANARVKLYAAGKGEYTVNGKPFTQYFPTFQLQQTATAPLALQGLAKQVNLAVVVSGGGVVAQAQAVSLAIARAMVALDPNHKLVLKKQDLLTRDARKKERKKPGLKRARRAPQWQKR
ncbi:MAG: 30S ribosomal protein S9 [Candidatus Doudnabacteria bacterium]|nr:30S ribosomal protein S9 [Candidatus Doudnabacteria bacterium]